MPGVNGEVKKEGLETNEEKRDLGSKPKKFDDKTSKTRRTSELGELDAERQCLVQRPNDQQWRMLIYNFLRIFCCIDFLKTLFAHCWICYR